MCRTRTRLPKKLRARGSVLSRYIPSDVALAARYRTKAEITIRFALSRTMSDRSHSRISWCCFAADYLARVTSTAEASVRRSIVEIIAVRLRHSRLFEVASPVLRTRIFSGHLELRNARCDRVLRYTVGSLKIPHLRYGCNYSHGRSCVSA